MHCYCMDSLIHLVDVNKLEFSDGNLYCKEWLSIYFKSNVLIVSLAIGISLVNVIVKEILRCKSSTPFIIFI